MSQLLDRVPEGSTVLADIPIGLPTGGSAGRCCDAEARRALSPDRRSSVFSVPCRSAVYSETYEQAQARSQEALGRGLSRQSWAIVRKIREVDSLLASDIKSRTTLREVHPEVCFWGLAGHAMRYSKKTREGVNERLQILEAHLPGARETVAAAFLEHGGFEAMRDDIIDALVPKEPELDDSGLPMEMVYLRREAL